MADPNHDVLQGLIAQHGTLTGRGAPDLNAKNYPAEQVQSDDSILDPYYSYFFADGASVEMNSAGQVRKATQGRAPGAESRPPQPDISTTARERPVWNEQTNQYDWVTNQNYVPPTPPAGSGPPQTVSPGQGVRNPDGSYSVPIPATPADRNPATVSPGQAVLGADGKWTIPVPKPAEDTPAQASARRITEARSSAAAARDAEFALWKAKVDAGYVMTPKDEKELADKIDAIKSERDSNIRIEESKIAHELAQPNVIANRELTARQVATGERSAETAAASQATQAESQRSQAAFQQAQVDQADRNQQADVYKAQAADASSFLDTLTKSGVAASMGSIKATTDPLRLALSLTRQTIKAGQLPPTAMPTPAAPAPPVTATSRTAPAPSPRQLTEADALARSQ